MKILLTEADGALAGRLFHLLVKNGYQTTAVKPVRPRSTRSAGAILTWSSPRPAPPPWTAARGRQPAAPAEPTEVAAAI